ncbi:MAG: LLM class F420-dependent oxidoreductase [Thermoproteota archaeon]|nr:LLM class F420-dependent oxidoreductase [Thermoproteota archaeon]
MQVGLRLPQTGRNQASKGSIVYLAKQAENAGFNSLWVLERLLWPINPQNPYPGSADGKFPEDWQYIFDPLETLTFVAAITNKIALGTSVIDMLFHNPVILAKRFATLDVFSDGRAIAGFGIGWSEDEYRASGIPFINRGKRADEYIQLLKMLWTEDIVEFIGEYYDIPASKVSPKPVQNPHIPIYLGGYSQKTFARIAKHANGWICTIRDSLSQVKLNIEKIKEECHKVNRDPKDINIAAILYPNVIDSDNTDNRQGHENQRESRRVFLNGDIDQVGRDLLEIKNIGVGNVIFNYNRSPISNNIDGIIDVSKKLREFIR